jgi:transcriptional regulator with XRE-family HTH domain
MLMPSLCRAARGLLNWSQDDLVAYSGVTKKTIADFERGATRPYLQTLNKLTAAFEAAGIQFFNGGAPGLRLKPGYRPENTRRRAKTPRPPSIAE